MRAQIPDRWLERYVVGELDDARRREVEAARAADPEVARRLDALLRSNEEILARYPPAELLRRRPGVGWQWPVVALVGAAAAALLLVPRGPPEPAVEGGPTERVKGLAPQLQLYGEGRRTPLREGERVRQGDVLQIAFVRGDAEQGAILAIDGRGGVTVHAATLPPSGPSGAVVLDAALVLDDAPGFERFFLVTCPTPLAVEALVDDARAFGADPGRARTAPLPIPPDCRQTSRLLVKDGTP